MASAALDRARDAFAARSWAVAHAAYTEASEELDLADRERQAIAAHLVGQNEGSRECLLRGYRDALRDGQALQAAQFAFWLSHGLMFEGRTSESSGWLARAKQLVNRDGADCVQQGYLSLLEGVSCLMRGDSEAARQVFAESQATGRRFGDPNLVAMAGHGLGRALVRLGRVAEGMSVLDEVIVAVAADEISPMVVGDVYCGTLEACHEVFDVRRAREWTGALTRWCEGQTDLAPYRGPCLVYRAEVMQFQGAWADAFDEVQRACEWLSAPGSPEGPGDALYRLGELHRLRGAYEEAEEAYRQAARLGRRPEPGLALLWLARGQAEAAGASIRRALDEGPDPSQRALLLEADIQVQVAVGNATVAKLEAAELAELAAALDSVVLRAVSGAAEGSALLAEGNPGAALPPLRKAWTDYHQLEALYDGARTRMLIAIAYRDLGDREAATMELDAARWVLEQLGALPDLERIERLMAPDRQRQGGLSGREIEVVRLVAAGHTNREIGNQLVISEHTVARHIQNMLSKLGLTSRAALAAYGVERGLISPGRRQI